ncbi:hypothetical protein OQA88_10751 [Cercophora sp. LCS_1]
MQGAVAADHQVEDNLSLMQVSTMEAETKTGKRPSIVEVLELITVAEETMKLMEADHEENIRRLERKIKLLEEHNFELLHKNENLRTHSILLRDMMLASVGDTLTEGGYEKLSKELSANAAADADFKLYFRMQQNHWCGCPSKEERETSAWRANRDLINAVGLRCHRWVRDIVQRRKQEKPKAKMKVEVEGVNEVKEKGGTEVEKKDKNVV